MERIESFRINHLNLFSGLYVSRKDKRDGVTVTTFDLRITAPNREPVIDMPALHTIEHLGATFLRSTEEKESIVYFGPMGCRTGFYFITLDTLSKAGAIALTRSALKFCAEFEGEIPGVSAEECGNYRDHDLETAKKEAEMIVEVLKNWTEEKLVYPTK